MATADPTVFVNGEDLDAERLNEMTTAFGMRLKALETQSGTYNDAIAQLVGIGLQRLNDALRPVYSELVALAHLGAVFTATSSSAVLVGAGLRTFVIDAPARDRFAPAAYLAAQLPADPGTMLFGRLQSYSRETGALVVVVEQFEGAAGALVGPWLISAAGTPSWVATAKQVGAYTRAEVDAALVALAGQTVSRAGNGVDFASPAEVRRILGLRPGTDVQAYSGALAALAQTAPAADRLPYFTGPNGASSTTLTTFARGLLDDADAATMRATLGANGNLVREPTVITTSGTFALQASTRFYLVELLGGGGGGASAVPSAADFVAVGAGGSAGGWCRSFYPRGAASAAVVIGAGGAPGSASASSEGGIGGNTTWTDGARLVTARGGGGGQASIASPTAATVADIRYGGTGTGQVSTQGAVGGVGIGFGRQFTPQGFVLSGRGASSPHGYGGPERSLIGTGSDSKAGIDAGGYGSGGGGAATIHQTAGSAGGRGSPGLAIVWEFS